MREPKAPTVEELLAELEAAAPKTNGGKTTDEWAREWKINIHRARDLIRLAIQSGRMSTTEALRPDVMRPGSRCRVFLHAFRTKGKR
jgi:hypothetical protein